MIAKEKLLIQGLVFGINISFYICNVSKTMWIKGAVKGASFSYKNNDLCYTVIWAVNLF